MSNEMQIINFEKHLIKKGYSNLVIGRYLRKVKEFLKYEDMSSQRVDNKELKKIISNI